MSGCTGLNFPRRPYRQDGQPVKDWTPCRSPAWYTVYCIAGPADTCVEHLAQVVGRQMGLQGGGQVGVVKAAPE